MENESGVGGNNFPPILARRTRTYLEHRRRRRPAGRFVFALEADAKRDRDGKRVGERERGRGGMRSVISIGASSSESSA